MSPDIIVKGRNADTALVIAVTAPRSMPVAASTSSVCDHICSPITEGRKPTSGSPPTVGEVSASVHPAISSGLRPLPGAARPRSAASRSRSVVQTSTQSSSLGRMVAGTCSKL